MVVTVWEQPMAMSDGYRHIAKVGPEAEERLAMAVTAFACPCGFIVSGVRRESVESSVMEHALVSECVFPNDDRTVAYWFRGTLRAFRLWVQGRSRATRRIT